MTPCPIHLDLSIPEEVWKAARIEAAKHQPEVDATHARIEKAMGEARKKQDRDAITTLRKELADFGKRIAETIAKESRALLKQRFDYPIFLYDVEKVGISATGEPDLNELYPNDRVPPGIKKTCIELYREFREEPALFFVEGPAA